jgi:hypothetical protein
MIWADRLALVWGGLLALAMLLVWNGPGPVFDNPEFWRNLAFAAGIPWLVLRSLDFIASGWVRH